MDTDLPARVRWIIERTGKSQRAVAAAIDLDETKLAKSLAGKRRFTSLELALIADLGGTSVDWILTGVEPRSFAFARRVVALDRTVGDVVGEGIVSLIAERFDAAVDLGFAPSVLPLPKPNSDSSYVHQANELAARALAQLAVKVRRLGTAELIRAVERAFGVHVAVYDLPPGVDGLSFADGDLRVIVLATTDRAARQRFTLAHELAHILWGDASRGVIEETMFGVADQVEKRANVFAAAFITPEDEIRAALGAAVAEDVFDALVWDFAVSPDAMAWRLHNLGMLTDDARARLARRTAAVSAKNVGRFAEHELRVAAAQTPQAPGQLSAAYLQAYIDGEIAAGPVAQLTGWTVEEVRNAAEITSSDIDWLDAFGVL